MPLPDRLSDSVVHAARQIGEALKTARLRRNDPISVWSERLGCSPGTVSAMERGEVTVAFGYYLAAAEILQKLRPLAEVFSPDNDTVGLELAFHARRKRARLRGPRPTPADA